MKFRIPFWLLLLAVVSAGVWFGSDYARERGLYLTTRAPLASSTYPELEPRANADIPGAHVGATIKMTPNGYMPINVTIQAGDALRFENDGDTGQWPMSDPHPRHDEHPDLNADGYVIPGETWYVVLKQPGTYGFHDEVYPNISGTVTVQ